MNGKCNQIFLDEGALMRTLARHGKDTLEAEGNRLAEIMKHEVQMTTHGGAPGKQTWRDEITRNIRITTKGISVDRITIDVGYESTALAEEVRAQVVAHGSGDKAEGGGGEAIHAGPTGRSVWGDDLSE